MPVLFRAIARVIYVASALTCGQRATTESHSGFTLGAGG